MSTGRPAVIKLGHLSLEEVEPEEPVVQLGCAMLQLREPRAAQAELRPSRCEAAARVAPPRVSNAIRLASPGTLAKGRDGAKLGSGPLKLNADLGMLLPV